jgi:pilus assembly protein CpaB
MGRLRGVIWMIAGLVLAVLAGGVAFTMLSQAATVPQQSVGDTSPKVEVVVAARAVAVRSPLTVDDIALKEVPAAAVPEGAVTELDAALGKVTTSDLYADEIVVTQRLLDPTTTTADGRLALIMTEDQVLLAIPAQDLLSRINILKAGDQVDVLFSGLFPISRERSADADKPDDEQNTFTLLENVTVAALTGEDGAAVAEGGTPTAVLVTVPPQDALAVKFMIDAGGTPDLVLRAPGANRLFDTDPVDLDYLINRYNLPIGVGE